MSSIYTRRGDNGLTSDGHGGFTGKQSAYIEFIGTIDELQAHIGMLQALLEERCGKHEDMLDTIQTSLFELSSQVVTGQQRVPVVVSVERIEEQIDRMESQLHPMTSFIVPGGSVCAAQAHVCRTVCRRTERCLWRYQTSDTFLQGWPAYLNRLSDFFFAYARYLNFMSGIHEKTWKNTCR